MMGINSTYCDDQFKMYSNVKSLSCTPGTSVLYTNYTSKTKKREPFQCQQMKKKKLLPISHCFSLCQKVSGRLQRAL